MKNKFLTTAFCSLLLTTMLKGQVTVPSNSGALGDYVGWDALTFQDLDIEHRANFPIKFRTNSFERLSIANGLGTNLDGRIAIGNNLIGFIPQARLHLYENTSTTGAVSIAFSNGTTGTGALDGYSIGVSNITGDVFHSQLERRAISFFMPSQGTSPGFTNWFRLQHGNNTSPYISGNFTDGYVGLNEGSPFFHLEQRTPAFSGGELLIGTHPSDVANSRMGMLNGTAANGFFLPTLFGNLDASQTGTALQTHATIHTSQDVAGGSTVQRFRVGMNWDYNIGGIQAVTAIRQRPAFTWENGNNIKMWMNANGQTQFGNFLSTATALANRVEITSDLSDVLGGQIATNGASGLRFTHLTSAKTPYAVNPGPGVLSVNAQGDVIYVPAGSGGGTTLCGTIPVNNVTKNIGGNTICQTNITDMFGTNNNVGINNTIPNDALDVGLGNIDVNNATSSYKLNDNPVLWHKGNVSNIYVGIQAAAATTIATNTTVVGYNAAALHTNLGSDNTVMGNEAAYSLRSGQASTYIGTRAGYINADGSNNNTYVGAEAGENGLSGADENVLVGWRAGRNIAGLHNVCVGNMSGINNSGYANTFIGIGSGMTSSGQFNIAIGSSAGPGVATLNNTAAIGANCFPMASNSMILGDNTMNVGIGLSGIASGPLNKLEINTTTGSPYFGSINGSSGLRFRNMTSANTPLATVFNGVLSVDANGDVILVQDKTGGAGSVGNYCGSPSNPLLSNFEVPLANSNYHFVGDIPLRDKVNIGNIPCSTAPLLGKLNVNTAVPTDQSSGINSYSIHAINTNPTAGSTNTAVYGEATNPSTGLNFMRGVWGKAEGESEAIGVLGQAGQAINSYGGRFEAVSTSGTNYGIYAEALNGTTNYAVYASAGGVNYSGLGPDWAGYFDGDVFTTTSFTPSDKKLKKDIKNISNSLDIINKLNPVTYLFDVEANRDIRLPSTKQYGFISQEVKEVLPELTKTAIYPAKFDKSGKQTAPQKEILSLNYNGFIAILAEGIKEQQAQIEQQEATNKALQQQVNELKALVNGLISDKSLGKTSTGNSSVTLSDKNALVLNQNVPNPFAESTVITYNIPGDFQKAQIIFTTTDGKIIKTHDITEKGKGVLNVFADDLSSGVYTYTLVVDGKTIDSKKMMKE